MDKQIAAAKIIPMTNALYAAPDFF